MSLCITIWDWEHAEQIHWLVEDPPGPKHRQLARQVGASACQFCHPSKFRMADPIRPLCLGTVVWFGSLEFMSLGHGYSSLLEPHQPMMKSRTGSPGVGGAWATALAALARHDASMTTPTLHESRAARCSPLASYDQLLAQGPWLGTCLA